MDAGAPVERSKGPLYTSVIQNTQLKLKPKPKCQLQLKAGWHLAD